jgi:hypothetical protein
LFDQAALKELLASDSLSNSDKLLTCLAVNQSVPKTVSNVKELAVSAGLRAVSKWNISSYFSKAKTLAIRTPRGWELTASGKAHVTKIAGPLLPSVSVLIVSDLRKQLPLIKNIPTRSFVDEAVKCLESRLYRSAIVTSWVGAISVLYDEVMHSHLSAFNAEALKRDPKWRQAKSTDDLARMKEFDFLQILPALSILGKSVKDELESCLKLRNGCGHPNSLIVGEHKASAHVETLIQNVFAKF